jgi:hypothetical protein
MDQSSLKNCLAADRPLQSAKSAFLSKLSGDQTQMTQIIAEPTELSPSITS